MELLLGAGSNHARRMSLPGQDGWSGLITLDLNKDHKPDVVHDLNVRPWPFVSNTFDECHAYDVMEHLSQQGDYEGFFAEWSEVWRILKPGGLFFGMSPHWASKWAWGDPGHRRVYGPECVSYLSQPVYDKQVGVTAITDYRFVYRADFDIEHSQVADGYFTWVLRAVKPSRIARA